jgi:hypothetical protein
MNTATEATVDESVAQELALSERGDPARTHPAEHVFGFKHHLVSATREPEDVLRFEYWSRHTATLRVGDFVFCEPADMSWWAAVRVLEVCGEGLVVQPIFGKEALGYQAPPPKPRPLGENAEDFEFRKSEEFIGKWAVVRKHDGLVATKGQPLNRAQCEDWLRQYLATVRK